MSGFLEPDHGSDLGNVQTRAVKDGDEYVVNGSKVWTTLGNYADHDFAGANRHQHGAEIRRLVFLPRSHESRWC